MPGQTSQDISHTPQNKKYETTTAVGDQLSQQALFEKVQFGPDYHLLKPPPHHGVPTDYQNDPSLVERKREVEQKMGEPTRFGVRQNLTQTTSDQPTQFTFEKAMFGPSYEPTTGEKLQQATEQATNFTQETMEKLKDEGQRMIEETHIHENKSLWQQAKEFFTGHDEQLHDQPRSDRQAGIERTEVVDESNKTFIDKTKENLDYIKDRLLGNPDVHIKQDMMVGQEETPDQLKGNNVQIEPTLGEVAQQKIGEIKDTIYDAYQNFVQKEEVPQAVRQDIEKEMDKTKERLFGMEPYETISE